jgi:alpha-amylase/4-alpha-glucanotransferase-like protein
VASASLTLFVDRILPESLRFEQYPPGDYWANRSWARSTCAIEIERGEDAVEIVCTFGGIEGAKPSLVKRYRFAADGGLTVGYRWDRTLGEPADLFATELSLSTRVAARSDPPAELWSFPIETVAKSERGLDRTRQGESITFRWRLEVGEATVELIPLRRSLTSDTEAEAPAGSAT